MVVVRNEGVVMMVRRAVLPEVHMVTGEQVLCAQPEYGEEDWNP